ncbi:MAG: DNA internalization-related competence protein ComEC/Rec2 [Desulfobacterales bacterium]|nr:DNA internalization-related competence protein ComEC/Rec2 [Desulfobacterales bacterium]
MARVSGKAIFGIGRTLLYHSPLMGKTILFLFPILKGLQKRPLLLTCLGFIVGLFLSSPKVILLFLLTALAIALLCRISLGLLMIWLLGLLGGALVNPPTNPSPLLPNTPVSLQGTLARMEKHPSGFRCLLTQVATTPEKTLPEKAQNLKLIIKGHPPHIKEGMRLSFQAPLRAFTSFQNPGNFDYKKHMTRKGVGAWAVIRADQLKTAPATGLQKLRTFRFDLCHRLRQTIFKRAPSPEAAALVNALVLGDRSHITFSTKERFAQTGTAHLLAISGLHLGIVTTLFFVLFSRLLSLWRRPLLKGRVQPLAAVATLFPLCGYALLSGMAPSTQRALVAMVLFLFTLTLNEEVDLPTTLGLAALLILSAQPKAIHALSFQLSFAAVMAIFAGLHQLRLLKNGVLSRLNKPLQKLLFFLIPPTCAWLGTAPLIWHNFGYIAPSGLLANLVVVPLASLLLIPSALLATFTAALPGPFSDILFFVAGYTAQGVLFLIGLFHRIPAGSFLLPTPRPLTTTLVMVALFSLLLSSTGFRKGPALVSLIALLSLAGVGSQALQSRFFNKKLSITILDVGQGSAAVIAFPNGRRWLVDGGFAWPNGYDTGRLAVAPYLQSQGILRLDAVILTHPESDHMGGLIHIINRFKVQTFIHTSYAGKGVLWDQLMDAVTRSGCREILLDDAFPYWKIQGATITCLNPGSCPYPVSGRTNNNSIVLHIAYGNHSFLLTGDILKEAENCLIQNHRKKLSADLLFVPHHGSKSSSTPAFLQHVAPSFAAISVGKRRQYNLPSRKVVHRYTQTGCQLFRTDRHGAITFSTDGNRLTASSFLQP